MPRRDFLRTGTGAAALGAAGTVTSLVPAFVAGASRTTAPGDRVRFASIGTGVRGCDVMRAALTCPEVEIVAACDLYDGRLIAAQEVAGKKLPSTKDYRAILDRKDVDAVVVAVPDHWHRKIVEDACSAGAVFGNHTAMACHMANYSLDHKAMAVWDASSKTIKG